MQVALLPVEGATGTRVVLARDGAFVFEGVPAGSYMVTVTRWDERSGQHLTGASRVEVGEGGRIEVDLVLAAQGR